jgi:tetratricopeptide (TPR) repeat protein
LVILAQILGYCRRMRALALLLVFSASAASPQGGLAERIGAAQRQGHYGEAARLYGELIASGSDTPEMHTNRGIMLQLAGENQLALDELRTALRAKPDLPGANLFAGLAEFGLGHPNAALPLLERARHLTPENPAPLLALGKAQTAVGDLAGALDSYRAAVSLAPRMAEAWYGAGVAARGLADRELRLGTAADKQKARKYLNECLAALTRAVDLAPGSARSHLLLAESLRDSGKLVEAAGEYSAAINLDPKMEAAYLGLATGWWKAADFDHALPPLNKVLALDPKDPSANAMLGDILVRRGDYDGGERAAMTALAGNPRLAQAVVVMARIYLARKQPAPAIEALSRIVSEDPDGSYHYLLFRAYKLSGDEAKTKAAFEDFRRVRAEKGGK